MWAQLASEEPIVAHRAILALSTRPDGAVAFASEHLVPVPVIEVGQIERWIEDLDHPRFTVREVAQNELSPIRFGIELQLREALLEPKSPEQERRLQSLVDELELPVASPVERLQERAVRMLRWINSIESINVLRTLSAGDPHAQLTRAARRSLDSLGENED